MMEKMMDKKLEEVEFVYIPDSRFPCNYDDYHIRVRIRVKGLVKQTRRPHQVGCERNIEIKGGGVGKPLNV